MVTRESRLVRPRLQFENDFLQLRNPWARGRRWNGDDEVKLSLGAIGLLTQLMSHDPSFSITFRQLERDNVEGDYVIRRLVDELRAAGFLKVEKERSRGKIVGSVWVLVDPVEERGSQLPLDPDSPRAAHPRAAQPRVGSPRVADPHGIEEQAKEHLPTSERTSSSTRAGNEDDLDRLAAVCPKTGTAHRFPTPVDWCRDCTQVRGDGRIITPSGNVLREATVTA